MLPAEKSIEPVINTTCAWNAQGVTCTKRGIISQGTNGKAPFYCRDHGYVIMFGAPFEKKTND